jgi:hypothetical protein
MTVDVIYMPAANTIHLLVVLNFNTLQYLLLILS